MKTSEKGSFIYYVRRIFRKNCFLPPDTHTHLCVSEDKKCFPENFANLLNKLSQTKGRPSFLGRKYFNSHKSSDFGDDLLYSDIYIWHQPEIILGHFAHLLFQSCCVFLFHRTWQGALHCTWLQNMDIDM